MATSDALVLRLERALPASRSNVWAAITDPEQIPRWWGPQGFSCPAIEFEPRVGGRYRIVMQPPGAEPFELSGEFKAVEPPTRLAYTFVWDPPDPEDRETLASLSLEDRGDQTAVSLTQDGFATADRLEVHRGGWTDSLDRLAELLS